MMDDKTKEGLKELGRQVKSLLPDVNARVTFNCSKDPKHEPVVNVMLADVTRGKK